MYTDPHNIATFEYVNDAKKNLSNQDVWQKCEPRSRPGTVGSQFFTFPFHNSFQMDFLWLLLGEPVHWFYHSKNAACNSSVWLGQGSSSQRGVTTTNRGCFWGSDCGTPPVGYSLRPRQCQSVLFPNIVSWFACVLFSWRSGRLMLTLLLAASCSAIQKIKAMREQSLM